MLYVAPQEASTKYFSSNYVGPRFDSPNVKRIFVKGWQKNDVYEKIFADTNSSVLFKYAKDDATRCRGPATDHNIHDEVQDIDFDILPIIAETMSLSRFKREFFTGTPLTTDNTINVLWLSSTQMEWASKCSGCNHWNTLTFDNNPLKMIQPIGLCCSKCGHVLNTSIGEWVTTAPSMFIDSKDGIRKRRDLVGYHLAQPLLPFFNQNEKEWKGFYNKVTDGKYGEHQVYNEALGLAYDVGTKPITEQELKRLCVLGPQMDEHNKLLIYEKNRGRYVKITTGVDWGVNMVTSRTSAVHGAIRNDGVYEVFYQKIYQGLDYNEHINDVAKYANMLQSIITCDSGPDPIRGHNLGLLTSPTRILLARYTDGKLIHNYEIPTGAMDWRQNRFAIHKSDCISFVIRMLKGGKILFPDSNEMKEPMQDILNEFIEVKDTGLHQQLRYSHDPLKPDDFLMALTYAVCSAYIAMNDPMLMGPSSGAVELSDHD